MNAEDPDGLLRLAHDLRIAIEAMVALYPPVFSAAVVKVDKGLIYVGEREYFRSEARSLLRRLRTAAYMQPAGTPDTVSGSEKLSTDLSTYPHRGYA